ncbi:hypothetical protein MSAN_02245000 [Mycena sanguinolenta]|uniref:Uncharacterized protein n=1 Tax=Mycena sanguinolenta TaxID=230812 RepID=A0A8H6XC12_9AGAR|nr:hypothetical protein MSAN_02245000 [Mycena sanguinolenta]
MVPSASRPQPHPPDEAAANPITLYSRALQAYTLRLWTETLKAEEERCAQKERESCSGALSAADLKPLKKRSLAVSSS